MSGAKHRLAKSFGRASVATSSLSGIVWSAKGGEMSVIARTCDLAKRWPSTRRQRVRDRGAAEPPTVSSGRVPARAEDLQIFRAVLALGFANGEGDRQRKFDRFRSVPGAQDFLCFPDQVGVYLYSDLQSFSHSHFRFCVLSKAKLPRSPLQPRKCPRLPSASSISPSIWR